MKQPVLNMPLANCFIDYRYIAGRDNYICQTCNKDLTPTKESKLGLSVRKINKEKELLNSNLFLSCYPCANIFPPLVPPIASVDTEFTGHLIVITGPMYAEKTTTSESYYYNYGIKYKNQIWVKPDRDDRATNSTTHSGRTIPSQVISAERPDQHVDELKQYEVIVIDEAQFFSERLIYVIHQLLTSGCLVIINGLKLTATRDFFGVMHYLLAEADEIVSLKAVCNICIRIDCATRTKSFEKNSPYIDTGGVEKYYAVCPACDGGPDEQAYLKKIL